MKVNNVKIDGPRIVSLCLPVSDDEAVEFKFRPLSSSDDFSKVMPFPKAPEMLKPGGIRMFNIEDPGYKQSVERWKEAKLSWDILKSLDATDGLEWETVKVDDQLTWPNWKEEVAKSFGEQAVMHFYNSYAEANILTEDTLDKARKRFLVSQARKASES